MMTKLLAMLFAFAVLTAVGAYLTGHLDLLLDARAAGFVIGAPWLLTLATRGARPCRSAVRAAFAADPLDLPPEVRLDAAGLWRGLAGQSLAAGLLVLLAGTLRHFGMIARAGGSVTPADLWVPFGALLLAPVYGLLLAAIVYEPLAAGLAADGGAGVEDA